MTDYLNIIKHKLVRYFFLFNLLQCITLFGTTQKRFVIFSLAVNIIYLILCLVIIKPQQLVSALKSKKQLLLFFCFYVIYISVSLLNYKGSSSQGIYLANIYENIPFLPSTSDYGNSLIGLIQILNLLLFSLSFSIYSYTNKSNPISLFKDLSIILNYIAFLAFIGILYKLLHLDFLLEPFITNPSSSTKGSLGPYIYQNNLIAIFAIVIPLTLYLGFYNGSSKYKIFSVLFFLCIILTKSAIGLLIITMPLLVVIFKFNKTFFFVSLGLIVFGITKIYNSEIQKQQFLTINAEKFRTFRIRGNFQLNESFQNLITIANNRETVSTLKYLKINVNRELIQIGLGNKSEFKTVVEYHIPEFLKSKKFHEINFEFSERTAEIYMDDHKLIANPLYSNYVSFIYKTFKNKKILYREKGFNELAILTNTDHKSKSENFFSDKYIKRAKALSAFNSISSGRLEIYQNCLANIKSVSIYGSGILTFGLFYQFNRDIIFDNQFYAHNDLLQFYIELGPFGIIPFFICILIWIKRTFDKKCKVKIIDYGFVLLSFMVILDYPLQVQGVNYVILYFIGVKDLINRFPSQLKLIK